MQELDEHIHSILLPPSFVSVPAAEDGFVSLCQQSGLPVSKVDETQVHTSDNWRNKAIRRKLSKMKELVLFIGGLPKNFEKSVYREHISAYVTKKDDTTIGPIFPAQGCLFINFSSGMTAACMAKRLHDRKIFNQTPVLIFLPFINMPANTTDCNPLLVFINSKSGGGRGKQVFNAMKRILNINQVFLLEPGGPIMGLYAFRKLHQFRILVCGGDGTVGWVLSAMEQVHRHVACKCPPIAVLPLGTGNDLARVLGFGSGWNGEAIEIILSQLQEAHPAHMDRWTILFDSSPQSLSLRNQALQLKSEKEQFRSSNNPFELNHNASEMNKPDSHLFLNGHRKLQRTCKTDERALADVGQGLVPSKDIEANVAQFTQQQCQNADSISQNRLEGVESSISSNLADVIQKNEQTSSEFSLSDFSSVESKREGSNSKFSSSHFKADEAFPCKSVHGKLQVLSEHDVIGDGTPFKSFAHHKLQLSKSAESLSPRKGMNEVDNVEARSATPEDFPSSQGEVGEMLEAGLPDIINDKHMLITLFASMNIEDEIISAGEACIHESPPMNHEATHKMMTREVFPEKEDAGPFHKTQKTNPPQVVRKVMADASPKPSNTEMLVPSIAKQLSGVRTTTNRTDEEYFPSYKTNHEPKVVTMSNYLGLGIDAEISLAFHLAREENPERFSSRFHNKAVYLKAGLKKITSRSTLLNNVVDLEVDGVKIPLPSIRGLIFLNITSWGAGANAWGSGVSRRFQSPSMGDGLLEVVGVGGVAHMSQMYGGLRNGLRIAQGEYMRIHLNSEVAAQVDGEPWMQPPGQIIITVSTLEVAVLKRQKRKKK